MPTGYTIFIEDGRITTAKDFIMLCARAFGATNTIWDEPWDAPIPKELAVYGYYSDRLKKAKEDFERYRNMTMEQVHEANEAEHRKNIEENNRYLKKQKALYDKYMSILADIRRWEPPTMEHEALKKFAIEQIEMCLPDLNSKINSEEKPSDEEWLRIRLESAIKNVSYREDALQAEITRVTRQNEWLAALLTSLERL